jgi:hypothetical protein
MGTETYVTIPVSPSVAAQLPPDADELAEILALGVKSWRVERALAAYGRGRGTLAYAAQQAGVSLREMIALAHAHGLQPKEEPAPTAVQSLDQASNL